MASAAVRRRLKRGDYGKRDGCPRRSGSSPHAAGFCAGSIFARLREGGPMTDCCSTRGSRPSASARWCARRSRHGCSTRDRSRETPIGPPAAGDAHRQRTGRQRPLQRDQSAPRSARPTRPLPADRQGEPGHDDDARQKLLDKLNHTTANLGYDHERYRRPRRAGRARVRRTRTRGGKRKSRPGGSAQAFEKARSGRGNAELSLGCPWPGLAGFR